MEAIDTSAIQETSNTYLGQWSRLVSQTNWEKGRIILDWRNALIAADAPATEYSDEAWAQQVLTVTAQRVSSQHVGRLRRVAERYAEQREMYAGLYWSHFSASLDWNDAEMWLEGAVQNHWSISQMKKMRAEVLGIDEPEIVSEEYDEDGVAPEVVSPAHVEPQVSEVQTHGEAESTGGREFDAERGNDAPFDSDESFDPDFGDDAEASASQANEPFRPFEKLDSLPEDVAEALEAFKVVIVRHRMSQWSEISQDQLTDCLDALKQLALAPAEAA